MVGGSRYPDAGFGLGGAWQAAQAEDLAAEWIGRWGAAVGKPRWGSGGDGVFELLARPGGAGGFELRHYQRSDAAAEPSGYLRELLSSSDYVVQQRYESHAEFSECADRRPRRRDARRHSRPRAGPEPFSCCVEIALPLLDGFARVAYVRGGSGWADGRAAVPRWQGELEASGGDGGPVTSELQRILSAVAGLRVPDFERAVEYALRAHRTLRGCSRRPGTSPSRRRALWCSRATRGSARACRSGSRAACSPVGFHRDTTPQERLIPVDCPAPSAHRPNAASN